MTWNNDLRCGGPGQLAWLIIAPGIVVYTCPKQGGWRCNLPSLSSIIAAFQTSPDSRDTG